MSEGWESGQGMLKGVVGIEESYSLSIRGRLLGAEMRQESYPYLNYSNFIEYSSSLRMTSLALFV